MSMNSMGNFLVIIFYEAFNYLNSFKSIEATMKDNNIWALVPLPESVKPAGANRALKPKGFTRQCERI